MYLRFSQMTLIPAMYGSRVLILIPLNFGQAYVYLLRQAMWAPQLWTFKIFASELITTSKIKNSALAQPIGTPPVTVGSR